MQGFEQKKHSVLAQVSFFCFFLWFYNSHIFNVLQNRYRGQVGVKSGASRGHLGGNPRYFFSLFICIYGEKVVILQRKNCYT